MSEYVQFTTWKEKALSLLPSFFKLLPKSLQVFIEITGDMIQEVEDQIPLIITQSYITTAEDIHLDRIGNLLSVQRNGNNNDVYRAFLLAKVISNRSTGVINDVYNIMSILGDTNPFTHDLYPATFILQTQQSKIPYLTPDLLNKIIRSASLPINLLVATYSDHYFGWSEDSDAFGFNDGELAEDGDEPYLTPLPTPTGLTQTSVSFDTIIIEWEAVEGATSYKVNVFDITNNETILCLNIGNVLTYTITGLLAGTDYEIRVKATNLTRKSLYTDFILVTTLV